MKKKQIVEINENYRDFYDLRKRTVSDKDLRDKAFDIAKNLKYDGYQHGISTNSYEYFNEGSAGTFTQNRNYESEAETNSISTRLKQANYYKYNKRKVYSSFSGNLWSEN